MENLKTKKKKVETPTIDLEILEALLTDYKVDPIDFITYLDLNAQPFRPYHFCFIPREVDEIVLGVIKETKYKTSIYYTSFIYGLDVCGLYYDEYLYYKKHRNDPDFKIEDCKKIGDQKNLYYYFKLWD